MDSCQERHHCVLPRKRRGPDLMAIVHTLSGHLYGMGKYKKQIQEDFIEYKMGPVKDALQ